MASHFISEIAVHEAILRGGRAIYLDTEDFEGVFQNRAAILGFDPKADREHFMYIQGGLADFPHLMAPALDFLKEAPDPTMNLVVVDAAESSGCPSDGKDVNAWLHKIVFPWHNRNHTENACLVVDHIPKSKENRPDGPIGSQRKWAALDGISLLAKGVCWTKTKSGRVSLINDKDRTGNFAFKEAVATIRGDWEGEGDARSFMYKICDPNREDATENVGQAVMHVVSEAGAEGVSGKNTLFKAIGGKRNSVMEAVDGLVQSGLLDVKKQGQKQTFFLTAEGEEWVA